MPTTFIIINNLEKQFTLFGYPKSIITENGRESTPAEFKTCLKEHSIRHKLISSYDPSTNGECFNTLLAKQYSV